MEILDEALELISYHNKKRLSHNSWQTLNRRFCEDLKAFHSELAKDRPKLSPSNIDARKESWDVGRIASLMRKRDDDKPDRENVPLIIVLFRGTYFLVDGRRRVNKWVAGPENTKYPVIILQVIE